MLEEILQYVESKKIEEKPRIIIEGNKKCGKLAIGKYVCKVLSKGGYKLEFIDVCNVMRKLSKEKKTRPHKLHEICLEEMRNKDYEVMKRIVAGNVVCISRIMGSLCYALNVPAYKIYVFNKNACNEYSDKEICNKYGIEFNPKKTHDLYIEFKKHEFWKLKKKVMMSVENYLEGFLI